MTNWRSVAEFFCIERLIVAQGNKWLRIVGACTLPMAVVVSTPRLAAAAESDAGSGEVLLIEEIIVTARLREEDQQTVPLSVYVLSDKINDQALFSLSEISQVVSGIKFAPTGRSNEQYIRGIGSGNNASFNQSAPTFVDGVYHGRSRTSGAAALLDIERVEILKGPQSTYFGNNAIAGAVSLISRKPDDEFSATTRALYGDFNQYAVEGAVNASLSDSFSVRVAAIGNGQEGYLRNVVDGTDSPDEDNIAGRVSMLWEASPQFSALLKLEASQYDQKGGLVQQAEFCPPDARFVTGRFCTALLNAGGPTGIDNENNIFPPGQTTELDSSEGVLTLNYRVSERVTVTSITSYLTYDYNLQVAGNPSPTPLITATVPEEFDQYSQEIRLASDTSGPIDYLIGLYYLDEDLQARQDTNFQFLPLPAALAPFGPLGQRVDFSLPAQTSSVFGSLTWHATTDLQLGAGVRASWVDKDIDQNVFYGTATQAYGGVVAFANPSLQTNASALGLGIAGAQSATRKDDAVTPSAQIQYTLTEGVMSYASYTRGFKAGGFNGVDLSGNPANLPYDPEYVDAYEVGLKTQWNDGKVLFNLIGFRGEYEDLQVVSNSFAANGAIISAVQNAASAISQGAEVEMRWAPHPKFRFALEGTYLDAYYDSYTNAGPTQAQQRASQLTQNPALLIQDLSGQPTALAPEWSGSLVGTYIQPIGSYTLTSEVSVFGSTDYFLGGSGVNDDLLQQDSYSRVDARIGLSNNNWSFEIIGKNLTDEQIRLAGSAVPTTLGSVIVSRQAPRALLAQIRYNFN
jgi:iron complex outermembrane receptor protein